MASGQPLPDSVPAALARGSSIGRYIVLAMVGRGGMGEVYAAYDPELDRKVAVKLLRVKPGNGVSLAEGRQRTLREAQAIARLSHPNVVVVYDVGTFEDKVFIAMEYVEGNTVTYWLQVQQRSLAGNPAGVHGRGARARGRARQGPRPPRLQDRQRDGQPRPPRARHGLRARAPGAGEVGARGRAATTPPPAPRRRRPASQASRSRSRSASSSGVVGQQRRTADDGRRHGSIGADPDRRAHRARACSTRA